MIPGKVIINLTVNNEKEKSKGNLRILDRVKNIPGGYGIDYKSIAATCIPFFVGMFLGGIDDSIKEFTKSGSNIMTPFLGFSLGSNINIVTALSSYTLGVILLIIFLIVNNIPMLFVDKIF